MEPRPRQELQPRESKEEDDDDQAWQDWIDDKRPDAPLPPVREPEQPGLHMPPPEEDYDPERDRQWRERRKNPDDPDSVPRGVWEMKK